MKPLGEDDTTYLVSLQRLKDETGDSHQQLNRVQEGQL